MLFKLALFITSSQLLFAAPGYFEPWGKDADLTKTTASSSSYQLSPFGWVAEKVILLHQNVLTKADGPRSHFRPTSARYMLLAIRRQGFFKGFIMGCDRLLRENEEKWIYQTVNIDGNLFKWNPPPTHPLKLLF